MSIAGAGRSDKVELVEMAERIADLEQFVRQAADAGMAFRDVERGIFDRLLPVGHSLTEMFIALQGDGDLGETTSTDDGRTLHRSEEPVKRPLRTIFGKHEFHAYVYRARKHPNTPIALRPVDDRMSLAPGRWSHLLQEFSQLFCIEEAYDAGAEAFERIFRQRVV